MTGANKIGTPTRNNSVHRLRNGFRHIGDRLRVVIGQNMRGSVNVTVQIEQSVGLLVFYGLCGYMAAQMF